MSRNHSKSGSSKFNIVPIIVIAGISALLYFAKIYYSKPKDYNYLEHVKIPNKQDNGENIQIEPTTNDQNESNEDKSQDFYPTSNGEIVNHKFYALSYREEWEQAEWVCYKLSKEILRRPNVPRSDWFNPDPLVSTKSATHFQYKGSGYTRGHLAPAGDMSFDQTAMEESFYMSNMSPQPRALNNGIWRELEEQTRDWTFQNKEVIIASGPIFYGSPKYFKKHKIAIPDAFYKIILDIEGEKKAVAFIIPNEMSEKPLQDYVASIDEVEQKTGINFFYKYLGSQEAVLESTSDISKWPISQDRYRLRVANWNHQ